MPTYLILILAGIGAVAAFAGLGLQLLAGADANGGTYSLMKPGEALFGIGAGACLGFSLWALYRWVGPVGLLSLLFAFYLAGSVLSYRKIKRSTQEYTRRDLIKAAAYSWFGVLLSDAG